MHQLANTLGDRLTRLTATATADESGQTMAEYAILIVVIAVVVLAAGTLLGHSISSVFSSLAGKL